MAVAFAQAKDAAADATATTLAATWASNTTTGNCVYVAFSYAASSDDTASCSVADSQGNTYTKVVGAYDSTDGQCLAVFVAKNITGGTTPTVTVTFPASRAFRRVCANEYSGVDTTTPVDTSAITAAVQTTYVCPAVTTSRDGCMIVAAINDFQDTVTWAAGSGYTLRATNTAGGGRLGTEEKAQASAGAITPDFTGSTPSGQRNLAATVALQPPSAPSNSGNLMLLGVG